MFIYLASALTPCIFVYELDYKSHMPMFCRHTNKNIIPCFPNEVNSYLHIRRLWIFSVLFFFYEYKTLGFYRKVLYYYIKEYVKKLLTIYFQCIESIFFNINELIRYVIGILTIVLVHVVIVYYPRTITEAVIYNEHIMKHICLALRQEMLCFWL